MEVTFQSLVPEAPVASLLHRARSIAAMLPPATPDRLVGVALALCDCDMDTVFEASLESIPRGIATHAGDAGGDELHRA